MTPDPTAPSCHTLPLANLNTSRLKALPFASGRFLAHSHERRRIDLKILLKRTEGSDKTFDVACRTVVQALVNPLLKP